jgi:hypothetical protein
MANLGVHMHITSGFMYRGIGLIQRLGVGQYVDTKLLERV